MRERARLMYFQWKWSGPILYHYSDLCLHSAGVALFLGRTKYSRASVVQH